MLRVINDNMVREEHVWDWSKAIMVTDPPFNVGYHYNEYKDRMGEKEYFGSLYERARLFKRGYVLILPPTTLSAYSAYTGEIPVWEYAWVYPSNTASQFRLIGFFGVMPDKSRVLQPPRQPDDPRNRGKEGVRMYDWFEIPQVKNVSKDKAGYSHPCIMPVEVMKRVINTLPRDAIVVDPYLGSGTTLVACKELGYDGVGVEMSREYCDLARSRLGEDRLPRREQVIYK